MNKKVNSDFTKLINQKFINFTRQEKQDFRVFVGKTTNEFIDRKTSSIFMLVYFIFGQ